MTTPPKLGVLVAHHLADAVSAFKRGADSLRLVVAHLGAEPVASLDPELLATLAAVTDANRGAIERMEEHVKRLLPEASRVPHA